MSFGDESLKEAESSDECIPCVNRGLILCLLACLLAYSLSRKKGYCHLQRCGLNNFKLTSARAIFFLLSCSWPNSGCCSWDDSHSYELKHRRRTSGRVFIPRGILVHRIPCPVFSVMDVFNALWRPVAPIGNNKMVAVLFWTKW